MPYHRARSRKSNRLFVAPDGRSTSPGTPLKSLPWAEEYPYPWLKGIDDEKALVYTHLWIQLKWSI